MKTLLAGLAAVAAAVFAALAVKNDNGYVLLGYGEWTLEGSLAFFLLANLALFLLLYLALRLLARLWAVPGQVHGWQERRGTQQARKALTQGLVALSEGDWKSAEKKLIRHAERSEAPLLNYLAAARSAQQQGADRRRDRYLAQARDSLPAAGVAVGLTQAELQLAHDQLDQAKTTLHQLRQLAPRHNQVLQLQKELCERTGDWQGLNALLPDLKKRQVLNAQELQSLEARTYGRLLEQAALDEDPEKLSATWKQIPAGHRNSEALLIRYANLVQERGEGDRAEALLRAALSRDWSDTLAEIYGRAQGKDAKHQLAAAESWLRQQPDNPVLLLVLGRLCIRNKLWGKARSYLEASIGAGPSVPAYRELGALLESMGEEQRAMDCFKSGLELGSDFRLPALPPRISSGQAGGFENTGRLRQPTDINPPNLEALPESK